MPFKVPDSMKETLFLKLLDINLIKKLYAFYGKPKFTTVYKKLPFVCVLSQINPLHAVTTYCFKIDFKVTLPFKVR